MILPHVNCNNITVPPITGEVFDSLHFCNNKAKKDICLRHYTNIRSREGYHVCPYGFTTFVTKFGNEEHAITGLRVKNHYDRAKIKQKLRNEFSPEITEIIFDKLLKTHQSVVQLGNENLCSKRESEEYNEFVKATLHEIRSLNRDIKSQAEEIQIYINRAAEPDKFISYRVENIFGTSSLVSIRLNAYDFIANPLGQRTENSIPTPIYRKFEKVRHCLNNRCASKNVKIIFSGTSYDEINAYPIFELLPYVIFDNAIKYTPKGQDVTVNFLKSFGQNPTVEIENIGPLLGADELPNIVMRDTRGCNVKGKFDGTGIGLYFAKQVCTLHNIEMKIYSSHQVKFSEGGVPFSDFKIVLKFPS